MGKKSVTLTVDENIWELAKDKLPVSRSEFFENQLRLFLNVEDPEAKIVEKITKKENEINVLKDKLCHIRREKQLKLESANVFDEAMVTINRLHDALGCVGRNQIRNVARRCDVPANELEKHISSEGLTVVNFMEVPK